jgi:hypothetical protein
MLNKKRQYTKNQVITCGMIGLIALGLIGCGQKKVVETNAPVEKVLIETTAPEETTSSTETTSEVYVVQEVSPEEESRLESEAEEIENRTEINVVTGELMEVNPDNVQSSLPSSISEANKQLVDAIKVAYENGEISWEDVEGTMTVIEDEAVRNKYLEEIREIKVKETEAAVVQETQAPVKETQAPVQETQQVVQETQAPVPTSETLEEPDWLKNASSGEGVHQFELQEGESIPVGGLKDSERNVFH